jgi:hypothetical protein
MSIERSVLVTGATGQQGGAVTRVAVQGPSGQARQQSEDVATMFEWFDRVGADADIAALRRDFPEVRWHSFADWAREFDWSVLERTSSVA